MTTYQVGLLQGDELNRWWPDICHSIEMAPPSWISRMGSSNLRELIDAGGLQVWGAGVEDMELLILTRVVNAQEPLLIVELMTGRNLDQLLPAVDTAIEWYAANAGCSEIIVKGRAGWKKKLEPLGFKMHLIELARPVRRTRH